MPGQAAWLPGDGGLRRQDGGDEVGPLGAMLLVLRPQLVLRLQPPTHRLGGRGQGTRRPLGLQSERNHEESLKTSKAMGVAIESATVNSVS